jgi:small conductance mechanosensitive channel
MTNETANAAIAVADSLREGFSNELSQGQELCEKALVWLTDKGLAFAVSIVASAVILVLGYFVIKLIVGMVGKAVEKGGKKNTLFGNFIRNVTGKICWAILIVVVLGKLGVDVRPIVAGLGVTGFILGFAFQESLGNLASGLMIAINEPFKIGDYVIVAGLEGTVIKMDMMAVTLATADNKKVVIPNKSAWGAPITNFSALGRRRVNIRIGIDYGCDAAKAIKVALETLPLVPNVLTDPAPSVSVASLDDSQVTLNIFPWADGANYWSVYNDAQVAIKSAFEKNGINIPFPQLTIHMDK